MKPNLSASLEDYLEAIAQLTAVNGHAHTKEIAEQLKVKMPSVTGALRQLEKMGYIVYNAHYPVILTEEGERIAKEVMRRHGILKSFFTDLLGLTQEKASATACHLEHVVDSDTIERFVLFSKAMEHRTDARPLRQFLSEAMDFLSREETSSYIPLPEMEKGSSGTLKLRGKALKDTEEIFPLQEEDQLLYDGISPEDPEYVRIFRKGELLRIPFRIAENLWVEPC